MFLLNTLPTFVIVLIPIRFFILLYLIILIVGLYSCSYSCIIFVFVCVCICVGGAPIDFFSLLLPQSNRQFLQVTENQEKYCLYI